MTFHKVLPEQYQTTLRLSTWYFSCNIMTRSITVVMFDLFYCMPHPGSLLKRGLLPESEFFPFRVDLFKKGTQSNFDRVACPENITGPLNRKLRP